MTRKHRTRTPTRPLSEVRKQAWATRRAKYGPAGHRGYARRVYDQLAAQNAERFAMCEAQPRIFVRMIRDAVNVNPAEVEFELSEGRATELLAERERRAFERGRKSASEVTP